MLGPILFLLYINDFPKSSSFFNFTLFADDSTLSFKCNQTDSTTTQNLIETELSKVKLWLLCNKLSLNINKCQQINFSYSGTRTNHPLSFGSGQITQVTQTKFLGVTVDNNLRFKPHILRISKLLSRSLGILHSLKFILPTNILLNIYFSIFHCHLSYAVESWYAAPAYITNKIFFQQKKAVRAIFKLPFNSHTSQSFKHARILKLPDLFKFQICSLIHSCHISPSSSNISSMIQGHMDIHSYQTKNSSNLVLPRFRRSRSQTSFLYQAVREYNALPANIKTNNSIFTFKKSLKSYYLNNY